MEELVCVVVQKLKMMPKTDRFPIVMECKIEKRLNYIQLTNLLQWQRQSIQWKTQQVSNSHIVHKGLSIFEPFNPNRESTTPMIEPELIPGVLEAGWKRRSRQSARHVVSRSRPSALTQLQAKLGHILKVS